MKLGTAGRTVTLGIIGLGGRGVGQMKTLLSMPDVQVNAVCDVYEDRAQNAADIVKEQRGAAPFCTTDYREVLKREDVEAVVIMTSWQTHIPIAIEAMRAGKIVSMEVGGATSLDECWEMVRVSEQTGKGVMLLENCCYNDVEMALLNMIKQGVFGELVHCRGGYQHDLRDEIGLGDINRHYRQDNFMHRNGELYPTHELGPIATYLNLNRGNRMLTLVSMASKAVGEHEWLKKNRPDTDLAKARFNEGDIVTTMISCSNGETIMLTHDCTLPRPYSRGGYVQGVKGVWMEDGHGIYLEDDAHEGGTYAHKFKSDKEMLEKYEHPLWKEYREFGLRGGHGGMDYLVLRAFVESIQKEVAFPIDVYDTAAWMAITCLSEESIQKGSAPVNIPDFTSGRWMRREARPGDMFSLDAVYPEAFTE
ncbi:MAG: Gfo/Idh/MocA family oxidoreductase [Clostridia bacterium]|nr:Gfo/Idh/MocA family oxidoreductase [Clostridia bacterium]